MQIVIVSFSSVSFYSFFIFTRALNQPYYGQIWQNDLYVVWRRYIDTDKANKWWPQLINSLFFFIVNVFLQPVHCCIAKKKCAKNIIKN